MRVRLDATSLSLQATKHEQEEKLAILKGVRVETEKRPVSPAIAASDRNRNSVVNNSVALGRMR